MKTLYFPAEYKWNGTTSADQIAGVFKTDRGDEKPRVNLLLRDAEIPNWDEGYFAVDHQSGDQHIDPVMEIQPR